MFIICCMISVCSSCYTKGQSDNQSANDFYVCAMGYAECDHRNWVHQFFSLMQRNDIAEGYSLLINEGYVRNPIYGGNFLLENLIDNSPLNMYLTYRFAEQQGDVSVKLLRDILLRTHALIKDKVRFSQELKLAVEFEFEYLGMLDRVLDTIDSAGHKVRIPIPSASLVGRPQFLAAKLNLKAGNYHNADNYFKQLISANKYKAAVYDELLEYWKDRNADTVRYYLRLQGMERSSKCSIDSLKLMAGVTTDKLFLTCFNDVNSLKKTKDSIQARVLLCEHYLLTNQLQKVYLLTQSYLSADSLFSFSPIQQWERREYFRIQVKYLWQEKRYDRLLKLLTTVSNTSSILEFHSEAEVRRYLLNAVKELNVTEENFLKIYYRYLERRLQGHAFFNNIL